MDYTYIGLLIILLLCVADLHRHNRKVEEMFPDYGDEKQDKMRRELTIELYGFYLLIFALIILSVISIIRLFLK